MTRTHVYTLVASLVVGALIGLAIHQLVLVRYRAEVVMLQQGDIFMFRRAHNFFRSLDWLDRFATAHKRDKSEAYRELRERVARGDNRRLEFEYTNFLTRGDVRNLPEGAQGDLAKGVLGNSRASL